MEVPVIAAVNGFAVTGGFELALACDIMIAADTAQFADTHARVGVMPGGGMTARLPQAVGIRKAQELSLTGNYLTAQEAEKLGLVNRVVPKEKLMEVARELAEQILSCDPLMVRQIKRLYDLTSRANVGDGLRIEQDFSRAHSLSRDLSDMDTRRQRVMERGRAQKADSRWTQNFSTTWRSDASTINRARYRFSNYRDSFARDPTQAQMSPALMATVQETAPFPPDQIPEPDKAAVASRIALPRI